MSEGHQTQRIEGGNGVLPSLWDEKIILVGLRMKKMCAWCGKDMGDIPPYEDDDVTLGICEECYKEVSEGHRLGCEYLATCPFFNDITYGMPAVYKERYCREDYRWCGRYMAFKAEEKELEKQKYARAGNNIQDIR